ncbi:MAG TPA: ATP synthase F1 subunit delta [Bryobacteraceae bacterium]|jgi:F-type H+-transporting ATPase subunit delta|nr:ATP synthase F1 subunit delta [Bryobacteraceae bacterium]
MTDALSSHYAEALANAVFGPESGVTPEEATEQLKWAADLISESKDVERALLSPSVSKIRKQAIAGKLADQLGLHRLIKNFLLVVVSHRRIRELPAMQQDFELIVDERTGWLPAKITSAHELGAEQRQSIERALGSKLGKFIRAHYIVDPSVIGGIRAHIASREYDATVRGKLESMRVRLLSHA